MVHRKSPKTLGIEQRLKENFPKIRVNGRLYSRDEIYGNAYLATKFVQKNPRKARDLFYLDRNNVLGIVFAQEYEFHKEYGADAFHIGQEVGLEIQRPWNPVVCAAESLEEMFAES